MHLILAEINKYPKKESDVTQNSSVVPTKINFCGTAIAKKGKICIPFWLEWWFSAEITDLTEITLISAGIINSSDFGFWENH